MRRDIKLSDTYEGLRKQASALRTLYLSVEKINSYLEKNISTRVPILEAQLEGEKEMNHILTNEVEQLISENERLKNELRILKNES